MGCGPRWCPPDRGMEAMKAAISHWSHPLSPSSCIQEAHVALRHTLCSPHGMAIRRAQMGCQMGCQQCDTIDQTLDQISDQQIGERYTAIG